MNIIMISRTVLLLGWCALTNAGGLTPLSAAGDDNDCALYLAGPGRTSAFDYSLNLLRGNFGYEGQHTCITYDAVNQAYLEARKRILVSQPKGDWKAEDYASVGELILDISINLARTYGLTYEEIEKGLPLIDTSRTFIREVCPPVFSHVECRAGKYRRFDGLCNNIQNPTWGATMAPFQRLIGPLFSDGINAPRIGHTGRDLPLSRVVSRTMHPDEGFHDHAGTVMVIAWGQFMDHDYTLTGTPLDPINRNDPEECCKRPPHLKHPYCNEIRIPDDDYFYRLFGVKCIDFVRGFPSPRPGCRLGSRVPFNTLTGSIDGNTVYGVTEKFARKLRTGYGGLLRMNPVFKEYGLKDLLPLKLDIPDEGCTRPNKNMYCFEAGEIRVNEQLVLTVMHTLMAREHNRVAKALAAVNPHWDDETLFQEARRINIAEIQHITYNEFLPILLGKDVMEKFGLLLEKKGYWDGYDESINPDVIAGFAAAAYRFGHSLLPTAVERWSKAHKFIASKRLSDLIRRPYDLYRAGVLDEYVMGLMNQVAQAMDDSITQEVTNHLFKKVGARFGMDLVSFNMQRGREFGIPGYMEYRKFCGLSGANTFQDLFGSMPNETVRKYESIFEHPIDVDLWSGGVSERPLPGSMLGPTFACVIATQFSYSRRGDRFWYELPNQPSSFTPEQLVEIRKARLARVICDNTDIIDTVQLYPMVLPDHELNPRVPCRSGVIPSMDFSKWAEPAPFRGAAAGHFMTEAEATQNCTSLHEDNNNQIVTANITLEENTTSINCNDTIHGINTSNTLTGTNQELNSEKLNNSTNYTKSNNEDVITKHDSDVVVATNDTNTNNSVLNYLYKNEKENTLKKPHGHIRNSLKRRKRSNIFSIEEQASQKLPIIVDYETTHYPRDRERQVLRGSDLPNFNTAKHPKTHAVKDRQNYYDSPHKRSRDSSDEYTKDYDKNRDTDFNNEKEKSEERHEPTDKSSTFYGQNNHDTRDRYTQRDIPKFIPKSNETVKKDHYKEKSNLRFDTRENSAEKDRYKGDSYERNQQTSDESPERAHYKNDKISNNNHDSDESIEIEKHRNKPVSKKHYDSDETIEKEQYRRDPAKRNYHNSAESTEKEQNRRDPYVKSYDNSDESNEKEQFKKHPPLENYHNIDESIEREQHRRDPHRQNRHDKDVLTEREEYRKDPLIKNRHSSDESIEKEQYRKDSRSNYRGSDERTEEEKYRKEPTGRNNHNSDESTERKHHNINTQERNDYDINKSTANEQYRRDSTIKDSDESIEKEQYKDKPYSRNDKKSDENSGKRYYKANTSHDDDDEREQNYKKTSDIRKYDDDRRAPPYDDKYAKRRENSEESIEKEQLKEIHRDQSKDSYDSNEKTLEPNRYVPHKKINHYDSRHDTRANDSSTESKELQHFKERDNNDNKEYFKNNNKLHDQNIKINDNEKSSYIKQYPADFNVKNYYGANTNEDKLLKNNDIVEKLPLQHSITANSHNIESNDKIGRVNTSTSPTAIQDVDLGDFSYERIQVNKKGEVESLKDSDPSLEAPPISKTEKYKENSPLLNSDEINSRFDESKPLTHINDGEIKPVVEINTEVDSVELNNEDNSGLTVNEKLNIGDGKESLIRTPESLNNQNKEKDNGDVKQQFERIPLNYNHDGKEIKDKEIEIVSEAPPVAVQTDIISGSFEGSEEPPTNPQFDEHLNIKFDIEPIKLPEIKLPEDILAYAYEEPSYKKADDQKTDYYGKDKGTSNYYRNADEDHEPYPYREKEKKKNEDDENNQYNDDTYYGYDGPSDEKQNYQKSKDDQEEPDEENDDVDLYEKFVRERFGKRGSFDKRSEKLQDDKELPYNPKLQETIKNILKKTETTQKEADKSGDPNAGYLWTLEYGENL